MKKKVFLITILVLFFMGLIAVSNFSKVEAFTFIDNDNNVHELPDFEHVPESKYVIVEYFPSSDFYIVFFSDVAPITNSNHYGYTFSCSHFYMYNYSKKNNKINCLYNNTSEKSLMAGNPHTYVSYINFDLYDKEGNLVLSPKGKLEQLELNLTVNPVEKTDKVPVLISSDWYVLDKWNTTLYVTADNEIYNVDLHIPQTDTPIAVDSKFGAIEISKNNQGQNIYRYVYKVYRNGNYHFKIVDINGLVDSDFDTPTEEFYVEETITINNIIYSEDSVNNYINGKFDPTPFLSYEYVNDSEINIVTQKFFINEIVDLQCFVAKDISNEEFDDESKWTKVEARSFKDGLTEADVYQFCYNVKNDTFDADGTYYFKFYNVFLDKYTYGSIDINFEGILKVDGSLFFKYVSFFKERFGFFMYPFELVINVLNKIKNIKFEEPAFVIPDVNEPFTNEKLISSKTFNFNDLLQNDVFKNIHNIYLTVVDVIIIFALVNLIRHKIMGVFEK